MDRCECPTCRRQFPIVPHFMRGICPHCGRMLSELIAVESRQPA